MVGFIVLDSMEGGELFQRIQDRQDEGPFTERGNFNLFHYFYFLFIFINQNFFFLFLSFSFAFFINLLPPTLQRQLKLCMKFAWLWNTYTI